MTAYQGTIAPAGKVGIVKIPKEASPYTWKDIVKHGLPLRGLAKEVNAWRWRNLPHLWRGLHKVAMARFLKLPHFYGSVYLTKIGKDGTVTHYGLASMRVVTTAGVGYIVDAFQNSTELENMKYHGFGTGTGSEASSDTALGTEFTTQYASDSTRPTGTTTEGATANIYRTVATFSPDSGGTLAVTEHGVFSASSSGVLLDRSVFSAVNTVGGSDSIQATYDLTLTAGS